MKGRLHLIEDDLDLWLPYAGYIFVGDVMIFLRPHAAFADYLDEHASDEPRT